MSTTGAQGPGGAREQVARLLTLVPYLHARGSLRLAEAADELEVTPVQLLKDLKVLFMCGLPGGYPDDLIDVDLDALETEEGDVRGDGVIRVSNADYLTRPLRLTPTEASALIVALRALRSGAKGDTVGIVDRVLAKLETAADVGPVDVALDTDPVDSSNPSSTSSTANTQRRELTRRLGEAVKGQVQVDLDYYVPARDEMSTRTVDPHGLVEHGGHTYLDAWCHSAEAPRLFRLDRIARAEVGEVPVVSESPGPRDLADGLFGQDEALTRVTVRLAPAARWVIEYYPVENVEVLEDPPGSVQVDLLVADEGWLTRLLLRLAPHAHVVAPDSHTGGLTAAAQDAIRLYP